MNLNNNVDANIAYIEHFKTLNPKLNEIKCVGKYLEYQGEKIDTSGIYIQDILNNRLLFDSINEISADTLITIIKLHIQAVKIKEKELINKMGALKYE